MGHHINAKGQFQSDRHLDLDPDKIVVSFKHPRALRALGVLADDYASTDPELAADIRTRLRSSGVIMMSVDAELCQLHAMLEYVDDALHDKASDFALSFPLIRAVDDLRLMARDVLIKNLEKL